MVVTIRELIVDCATKDTSPDYLCYTLALRRGYHVGTGAGSVGNLIHSILDRAGTVNLTARNLMLYEVPS